MLIDYYNERKALSINFDRAFIIGALRNGGLSRSFGESNSSKSCGMFSPPQAKKHRTKRYTEMIGSIAINCSNEIV